MSAHLRATARLGACTQQVGVGARAQEAAEVRDPLGVRVKARVLVRANPNLPQYLLLTTHYSLTRPRNLGLPLCEWGAASGLAPKPDSEVAERACNRM